MSTRLAQSTRDRGITALVEGFFANAWFGWGHAAASATLSIWLDIASAVAVLVAIIGAVVGFRSPKSSGAINDRAAGIRMGIITGVEFGAVGIGAALLGILGQADYIPAWICAVVGIHFFALITLLRDWMLIPLGALMCAVAVAATVVGVTTGVAPSTITGVGAGCLLLVFAVFALAGVRAHHAPGASPAGVAPIDVMATHGPPA